MLLLLFATLNGQSTFVYNYLDDMRERYTFLNAFLTRSVFVRITPSDAKNKRQYHMIIIILIVIIIWIWIKIINKNKEQLKECPRQSNKEILDSVEFSSLKWWLKETRKSSIDYSLIWRYLSCNIRLGYPILQQKKYMKRVFFRFL